MTTLVKIISGGQTGADIAAIDAAIASNFPYGGTLPKGRKNEYGIVPIDYECFVEDTVPGYPHRTELNIQNSDGTLVFSKGIPTGGTKLTVWLAEKNNKPCVVISMNKDTSCGFGLGDYPIELSTDIIVSKFISVNKIATLNVAGPRESKTPGTYDFVYAAISTFLLSIKP